MVRTNSLILLIASATFLTANARAQNPAPGTKTAHISVAYGDLDLDKLADARILYSRLEKAAKRACGPNPFMESRSDMMPVGLKQTYNECRARALGDAVARLDAPLLSRVYAESHKVKPNDVANR
ncbi:MAG TPA: UrcA family protein [Burkholderiales bacterium]|nr:UrcA family protein [Burkholderiales bacterium]